MSFNVKPPSSVIKCRSLNLDLMLFVAGEWKSFAKPVFTTIEAETKKTQNYHLAIFNFAADNLEFNSRLKF